VAAGSRVRDPALLGLAVTHRSYCAENGLVSNERLEFLGDAVLGIVVTDHIFSTYPAMPEGELAKLRASVVSAATLAEVAGELQLGEAVRLGKGEAASGGRQKPSILADAMEAVFGALYLDGGVETARPIILGLLDDRIAAAADGPGGHDYKTQLQELAARRFEQLPVYERDEGPGPREALFAVVLLDGDAAGEARLPKKQAEQAAALPAAPGRRAVTILPMWRILPISLPIPPLVLPSPTAATTDGLAGPRAPARRSAPAAALPSRVPCPHPQRRAAMPEGRGRDHPPRAARDVVGKRIKTVTSEHARTSAHHKKQFVSWLDGTKVSGDRKHLPDPRSTPRHPRDRPRLPGLLRVATRTTSTSTTTSPSPSRGRPPASSTRATVGSCSSPPPRICSPRFEIATLGIDPVDEPMSWQTFGHLPLRHKMKLKAFLTDQSIIAGIGSVYADEVLFAAGLRYDRMSDSLSTRRCAGCTARWWNVARRHQVRRVHAGRRAVRRPRRQGRGVPGAPQGPRSREAGLSALPHPS
jgi:ribonuclease-3